MEHIEYFMTDETQKSFMFVQWSNVPLHKHEKSSSGALALVFVLLYAPETQKFIVNIYQINFATKIFVDI